MDCALPPTGPDAQVELGSIFGWLASRGEEKVRTQFFLRHGTVRGLLDGDGAFRAHPLPARPLRDSSLRDAARLCERGLAAELRYCASDGGVHGPKI